MLIDVYGVRFFFVMVTDNIFFISVDFKVFDSIYFRLFFRVRCIIQFLYLNGNFGISLKSYEVSISYDNGICNFFVFKGIFNSYSV